MTPQAESVLDLFRATGAYLKGHFRLTSGLHSPEVPAMRSGAAPSSAAEDLGRRLAAELRTRLHEPDRLRGFARHGRSDHRTRSGARLGTPFLFTERDPDSRKMLLRRGFTVEPGETAVVVEDVITTGGSTREVIDVLQAAGARVLAAGSIIDRSGGHAEVGVPRVALATLQVAAHTPEDCPLCRQGIPVVKPGSRPA